MGGKLAPPWSPRNRKIATRNARLHRLMRKGIIKPMTKDEQRALAQQAAPLTKPSA